MPDTIALQKSAEMFFVAYSTKFSVQLKSTCCACQRRAWDTYSRTIVWQLDQIDRRETLDVRQIWKLEPQAFGGEVAEGGGEEVD